MKFSIVRPPSLEVEPQHPDDYDRVLSLARTTALWNGLRRVYFGEQEVVSPPAPDMAGPGRDHAHDQVMMALQSEITTLEQRAAAARQRGPIPPDDGRPALLFRRNDDYDESPSGLSQHALLGSASVPVSSAGEPSTGASLHSKPRDDAGSKSDASVCFYDFPVGTFLSSDFLSDHNEASFGAGVNQVFPFLFLVPMNRQDLFTTAMEMKCGQLLAASFMTRPGAILPCSPNQVAFPWTRLFLHDLFSLR